MRAMTDFSVNQAKLQKLLKPVSFTIAPNCGGATKPRGSHRVDQATVLTTKKYSVASGRELVLADKMLAAGGFWWEEEVLAFFEQEPAFKKSINNRADARRMLQTIFIEDCYLIDVIRGIRGALCGIKILNIQR